MKQLLHLCSHINILYNIFVTDLFYSYLCYIHHHRIFCVSIENAYLINKKLITYLDQSLNSNKQISTLKVKYLYSSSQKYPFSLLYSIINSIISYSTVSSHANQILQLYTFIS